MRAARLQPSVDLDPDVQTGLGVLLNLSGDFDKVISSNLNPFFKNLCKKTIFSFRRLTVSELHFK